MSKYCLKRVFFLLLFLSTTYHEVNGRSPMISHLAAALEGLQSISVYRIQARFDAFNLIKIDASNKALYALTLAK